MHDGMQYDPGGPRGGVAAYTTLKILCGDDDDDDGGGGGGGDGDGDGDLIQVQGPEPFKVGNPTISSSYLLRHLQLVESFLWVLCPTSQDLFSHWI